MEFEQDCTDGSCRCKEGLRGIKDGRDRNAAYPAISQCRNASYNLGMLENFLFNEFMSISYVTKVKYKTEKESNKFRINCLLENGNLQKLEKVEIK